MLVDFSSWMTAMPPPRLSLEEPRCWWMVVKLSGARLWTMHPGASDGIQVSVKTRMSNAPSGMLSFMRAALLTADLELSRPNFRQAWFKRCKLRRMLERILRGFHIS